MSVEGACWALALGTLAGCAVALWRAWPEGEVAEHVIALGDEAIRLEGAEIVLRGVVASASAEARS